MPFCFWCAVLGLILWLPLPAGADELDDPILKSPASDGSLSGVSAAAIGRIGRSSVPYIEKCWLDQTSRAEAGSGNV